METSNTNHHHQGKSGVIGQAWKRVKAMPNVIVEKVVEICKMTKHIAQDDPRKVIHSLKVGLSISLVSLFYFYQPLYENFGLSAMWAVMTVVVVFEYTVGATLGKGLNRTLATLTAGALGVGAHYVASLAGDTAEPILIGFFVFLQAAIVSFIRFFPKMKARYDYGLLIFILTFSLISVSGFRDDEVLEMAHKRLSTIVIGGTACVMISIFVCPVWAGEELHYSIALNLETLAHSLQAFTCEYFNTSKEGDSKDSKSIMEGYKRVLNSKSSEDSLANFARWEPGHGKFRFRHPWGQYLKIGALTRQCAYRLEALNGHLNSDIQGSSEIRCKIQELCLEMSLETSKTLKELGSSIRTMTKPSSTNNNNHKSSHSKSASKNLKSLLQSTNWDKQTNLLSLIPIGKVASLLIDIVDCTETLADSVNDLATLAHFNNNNNVDDTNDNNNKPSTKPSSSSSSSQSQHCECAEQSPSKIDNNNNSGSHVVILVEESTLVLPYSEKSTSDDQHI